MIVECRYAEGEAHLKNALQVLQSLSKQVPPGSEQEAENHKGYAIVYDGLCFIAFKQKRYQEAENYGKQAHKYYSKGFGNQPVSYSICHSIEIHSLHAASSHV